MKKIFYIAIFLIIASTMHTTYSFADNTEIGDCNSIDSIKTNRSFISKKGEIGGKITEIIFNEDIINTAIKNLTATCCNAKILAGQECASKPGYKTPNSLYFLDHIFDIYIRSLDANTDKIYNDVEPDKSGKDRRDFTVKSGNDPKGLTPIEVNQKYKIFRPDKHQLKEQWNDNTQNLKEQWETPLTGLINDYENRTLYDKYNLSCDLVQYISYIIQPQQEDLNRNLIIQHLTTSEYEKCKTLIKNRIANETNYILLIQKQLSNKMLSNNTYSYLNEVFLNNKLYKLQQTFFDAQSTLSEINRNIKELTNQCS